MSKSELRQFDCPRCGKNQDFRIWDSVNVTIDPELREQVMSEEIFNFVCESCGCSGPVAYNMLYNDMDRQFMIWLLHPGSSQEGQDVASKFPTPYRMRTVDSVNRLKEKILILESDLDDVSVEAVKLELRRQEAPDLDRAQLFFVGQGVDEEDGVYVMVALSDGESTSFTVPRSYIVGKQQRLESTGAAGYPPPEGEWHQVDEEYAQRLWQRITFG
jgi:transcription elongation factor Elf1